MAYGVKLLVWGDYASFNRPELKVERVTYDVITPSAARGILEAIYWKPEIRWVVDRLHVLNPLRFTHVRRNEVKGKIPIRHVTAAMKGQSAELGLSIDEARLQRAAMILADVRYGIEAHLEVLKHEGPEDKPEGKHLDQFRRRAAKGACFHHPYFGTREFPASFALADAFPPCHAELRGERRLGRMLYDIEYAPDPKGAIVESSQGRRLTATPRFFDAVMRDGIIETPPPSAGGRAP
jgi:CRISPR-associated protein Cas5d